MPKIKITVPMDGSDLSNQRMTYLLRDPEVNAVLAPSDRAGIATILCENIAAGRAVHHYIVAAGFVGVEVYVDGKPGSNIIFNQDRKVPAVIRRMYDGNDSVGGERYDSRICPRTRTYLTLALNALEEDEYQEANIKEALDVITELSTLDLLDTYDDPEFVGALCKAAHDQIETGDESMTQKRLLKLVSSLDKFVKAKRDAVKPKESHEATSIYQNSAFHALAAAYHEVLNKRETII